MKNPVLHRAFSLLKHHLTAWNTRGEGIHSPYLFYLVEKIIYDHNAYYSWREIENRREAMIHSEKTIRTTDFGTGLSGSKSIRQIALRELESKRIGQLLFRLVLHTNHTLNKPLNIIELGTSLGISTAYLASPSRANKITTYEGSSEVADIALKNWEKLGLNNIRLVRGDISKTLQPTSDIDIAYIDANHCYEATILYYNILGARAHEKSIFIFDDIHHNESMEKAWSEIKQRPEVTSTMDLYHIGLIFFDPHLLKKHYKLIV